MELDEIVKQVGGVLKSIIDDNDIIPLAAKGISKMHKELIKEGFSRSEALEIICAFSHVSSRK